MEVQEFYQHLYTSQGFHNMDGLLQFVPERVTPEMNADLQRPFDAAEVRTALFQMAPSKAPGIDGFTAGFFQRHWSVVEEDLVPAVLEFLMVGSFLWV